MMKIYRWSITIGLEAKLIVVVVRACLPDRFALMLLN